MRKNEHFGMIGLKIGDKIRFRDDPEEVVVVSYGNGTPDNRAIFVSYPDRRELDLFSLRLMTRLMLGIRELPEDIDIWEYWLYRNKTLREMLDE